MFGFLLFPASIALLAWNERESACGATPYVTAQEITTECDCLKCPEDKLAFFSCPIDQTSMEVMTPMVSFNLPGITDKQLNFRTVVGSQTVEMFQCIEVAQSKEEEEAEEDDSDEEKDEEATEDTTADESLVEQTGKSKSKVVRAEKRKTRKRVARVREDDRRRRTADSDAESESSEGTEEDSASEDMEYKYHMAWSESWYNSHEFKATPENIGASGCPDFLTDGKVNHNPEPPDRGDGQPTQLGSQTSHSTLIRAGDNIPGRYSFTNREQLQTLEATERISMRLFKDMFSLPANTDNIVNKIDASTLAVHDGKSYYLSTCKDDRLGCIRISYNKSNATSISVLGRLGSSGVVWPYGIKAKGPAPVGCVSSEIIRMYAGKMSRAEMMEKLLDPYDEERVSYRIGGLILAWLALFCLFDPCAAHADVMNSVIHYIPCLNFSIRFFEGLATMFVCLVACMCGLGCGLAALACTYAIISPLIGAPIAAVAFVCICGGCIALKKGDRDPRKFRKKFRDAAAAKQAAAMAANPGMVPPGPPGGHM
jgi:hypothetical protein